MGYRMEERLREAMAEIDELVEMIRLDTSPENWVKEFVRENVSVCLRLPTAEQLQIMDCDSAELLEEAVSMGIAVEAIEIRDERLHNTGIFNYLVTQLFTVDRLEFIFVNNTYSKEFSLHLGNSLRWDPIVCAGDLASYDFSACMPYLGKNLRQRERERIIATIQKSKSYSLEAHVMIDRKLKQLEQLEQLELERRYKPVKNDEANAGQGVNHRAMAYRCALLLMEEDRELAKKLDMSLDELNTRALFKHFYTTKTCFNHLAQIREAE